MLLSRRDFIPFGYRPNVEINKTYYYKVSAVDEAGNESEKSESVEASLKDDVKH